MQIPLYIAEEIKIKNQVFIRIGFNHNIDKSNFVDIIQMFRFYGCYYLEDEKSWFVSKKIWKEGMKQIKMQMPRLFFSDQKIIQEKLMSMTSYKKGKF